VIVDRIYGKRILEFVLLGQQDEVLLKIKRGSQLCECEVSSLYMIGTRHGSGMENATTEINVVRIRICILDAPI